VLQRALVETTNPQFCAARLRVDSHLTPQQWRHLRHPQRRTSDGIAEAQGQQVLGVALRARRC